MHKIKFLVFGIIALTLMPCCNGNDDKKESDNDNDISTAIEDSLATANAERDSLYALMDEISEGMLQIKEMQDIVSVKDLSSETPDQKAQLRADMEAIQKSIAERKKKLADLEKRLSLSDDYNKEMKKKIDGLKAQLEAQQNIIDGLAQQLAAAQTEIKQLNTRVDSLNEVNTTVREEKKAVQEENTRLVEDVNTLNNCYYAIGSKKELKQHKIIDPGFLRKTKILEGDFEKSYFTKADKRTLTEIDLRSKKVKLWTKHPEGSYSIVENGGTKRLVINNPSRFWELSNYLVVQIN